MAEFQYAGGAVILNSDDDLDELNSEGYLVGDVAIVADSTAHTYMFNNDHEWKPFGWDPEGGGGGGTSDYSDLTNKPSINGVTLIGNKTTGDLGIESAPMTEITYSELKTLRDGGELIPGMQYRITDYNTIITGSYDLSAIGAQGYLHNARSAGHQFDVIVVADDESHLNENARAALHEGDTYFANTAIGAWKLKYCLDNDTTKYTWANANGKGVIFWMEDEFNNRVGYDFKNIQFLRYAMSLNSANPNAVDTGLVYDESTQPNRYAGMYQIFMALQGYMDSGTYVNPWGANGNYDFAVSYNILGTVQMPQPDATYLSTFHADWYYTFDHYSGTHYDASLNEFSKVPCRDNYIELETDPLFALAQGIDNVYGLSGSVWETNSVFTEGLSGTSRDNISENKLSMHCWINTFGNDCYGNTFSDSCFSNTFGNNCWTNIFSYSCYSNTFGNNCSKDTFGSNCYNNTLGDGCHGNTFKNNCCNNTFGDSCSNNIFRSACIDNTFKDSCPGNTFGSNCFSNIFGNNCQGNTFGSNCHGNTFGNGCSYNMFGDSCFSNTFGFSFNDNTFGNNCYGNTFGTYQNNELKSYMHYIHAEDSISYVSVASPGTNVFLYRLNIGSMVQSVSIPAAQLSANNPQEIINYNSQHAGRATIITKTGPTSATAVSTTDGGSTWTTVNLTATGVSF